MFLYQALIMLFVVAVVFVFTVFIKINRTVLAIMILVLVVAGSLAINVIQDYFGVHVYTQNINLKLYNHMQLSDTQKDSLEQIFSDYKNISANSVNYRYAFEKNYSVKESGVDADIKVDLIYFNNKQEADDYFKQRQTFYENKYFMFEDPKLSKKLKTDNPKYITSYIRSNYTNYNDIAYVPKNIFYLSEILVQNDDVIIYIDERSNKNFSEKARVLQDINNRLKKVA